MRYRQLAERCQPEIDSNNCLTLTKYFDICFLGESSYNALRWASPMALRPHTNRRECRITALMRIAAIVLRWWWPHGQVLERDARVIAAGPGRVVKSSSE
jgi:hypothetical protein